jgi:hypothetical protein
MNLKIKIKIQDGNIPLHAVTVPNLQTTATADIY